MSYKTAYLRTVVVLLIIVTGYALYDINNAYQALEQANNPFAGLVWNALPSRLISDGILAAILALPIGWLHMKWTNRHAGLPLPPPNSRDEVPS